MRSVSNDQKQNVKDCQQEEEGYPSLTQANDFFFFPLDSTKDLTLKAPEGGFYSCFGFEFILRM